MAISSLKHKPTAIIVGGGPVGLTAALGLVRAGIDFIVLEKRRHVVVDEGSDMTLLPMTMRALDQLSLLEPLSAVSNAVSHIDRIDHRGRGLGSLRLFQYMRESTGYYPTVISRRDLLQTLHRALPSDAHEKIHTGKGVASIQETPHGVEVTCTDGSTYHGTFIIGADGAHSVVRDRMRDLALASDSTSSVNDAEPFLTTYQALWIRFSTAELPASEPGMAIESHGPSIATQLFAGETTATVGVYKRLPAPTRHSARYGQKDEAALVQEWADLPLTKDGALCLRDVYEKRLGSGLVNLEEGILPHWSWDGRIVLVGDAAHKFTPSTGSGLNHGMLDSVVLMNELHNVFAKHNEGIPSFADYRSSLSDAFHNYQQKRMDDVVEGYQQASGATAVATWSTLTSRLVDRYLMPNSLVQWIFGQWIASRVRTTKPVAFGFESLTCERDRGDGISLVSAC